MKTILSKIAVAAMAILTLLSCNNRHFITDPAERRAVKADLETRISQTPGSECFDYKSLQVTDIEREALDFLYAYMPLADIADHSPGFFLNNIRLSFKAREMMPWGRTIPEREFRHFVLPVRVNNEDLDSARQVFFNELAPRVQHLSMRDAVLEVNHWCHEKVVYQPADPRTSSPLATLRTAFGRCGEESTFTVAALRSVGIPARQVYTPRWAHTDNNHAWVEAWVDGQWMFLGACEPEPVLNLGWFNAPASRSMLMHTKVFGRYNGPEEVMHRNSRFTEINVIDNYAPAERLDVTVVGTDNNPVGNATVQFRLYNYAELYTIATKQTDAAGHTYISAGLGDLVVWASKNGRYGFQKVSFGKDKRVTIALDRKTADTYSVDLDITPPAEGANMPDVTDQQRAENQRRLAEEDSIRNIYTSTFYSPAAALDFCRQYGYNTTELAPAADFITASRGNHRTITDFLSLMSQQGRQQLAFDLLSTLLPKDLRDVTLPVLLDNIKETPAGIDPEIYLSYVRCPRVQFELLTPYKAFFANSIDPDSAAAYQADPQRLVAFVGNNIAVDNECNLGGAPISPAGVWRTRTADSRSRNIFFVAMARSLDIPARIDPVTGKVQVVSGTTPVDIDFESTARTTAPTGTLRAAYTPTKTLDNPKYYNHFTISRILPDGTLSLLSYDEGDAGMEQGASWSNLLKDGTPLDTGSYLILTGSRLANGGVLANARTVVIREGETTDIELVIRHSTSDVEVIGEFNSESLFRPIGGNTPKSVLATTGRGYYVVAVLGVNQEPTNHALRDIAAVASQFEKWGRQMVLLFPSEEEYAKFDPADFGSPLPENITYGIDIDHTIQSQITQAMKLRTQNPLPIFIVADTFNRIVFCSQGYTINLGEQLMNTINKL